MAFVLPVDAPSTLLVDVSQRQDPRPVADRVQLFEDLVESVVTTVQETIPPNSNVALLGGETLVWKWGDALQSRLSAYNLMEDDALSDELRLIKSNAELDLLRFAGAVAVKAVNAAMNASIPGATEADVAAAAVTEIVKAGGAFYGMGLSSGEWAHTFAPSTLAASGVPPALGVHRSVLEPRRCWFCSGLLHC